MNPNNIYFYFFLFLFIIIFIDSFENLQPSTFQSTPKACRKLLYPLLRRPPHPSGVRVAWSLVFCLVFCRSFIVCPFVLFSFDHRIDIRLLVMPLVSFGHCIDCPSLIYGFWLCLWYLLTIVLTVLLWYTASGYAFGIFWPLYWLSFFDIRFWLCLWYLLAIVLTVFLWYTASGYALGIFWLFYWLSFFDIRLLVMPLVSFDHCIDCPPLIYGFWLCLWYLLAMVLIVLLWYTASGYAFCIFWPL